MTSWKPWFARIQSTVSERRSAPGSRSRIERVRREKRRSACLELLEVLLGDPLRGDAGDEALELGAEQERLLHLRARERPHAEAAVGLERDEAERREAAQRLAHRRPADRVLRRHLLLPEHGAGRELARDDRLLERERDLVGLGAGVHRASVERRSG